MQRDDLVRSLMGQCPLILGYIRSVVRNLHAAEDIFQEMFILALAHGQDLHDEAHASAWARKTAQFLALNELRKRHRSDVSLDAMIGTDIQELMEPQWQQAEQHDGSARLDALQRCLARLSPSAKRLIHLRFTDGLDCAAVALRLQRPLNTIYVGLSRIYKKLAQCMASTRQAGT